MNNISEKEIQIDQIRKDRNRKRRIRWVGRVGVFVVLAGAVWLIATGKLNLNFMAQNGAFSVSFSSDSRAGFYVSDKGYFQASKDGVKYYTKKNPENWQYNDTFTMQNPTLIGCGNFAGVYDYKGNSFRLYNEEGNQYALSTEESIIYMSLNKNGYMVLLTETAARRVVRIYNASGTEITSTIYEEDNQYPLTATISHDGRILAVSVLETGQGSSQEMISYVSLFFINRSEGVNFKDNMFSSIDFKDMIIPYLYFNGDNTLFCIGDSEISLIDAEEGRELWRNSLPNMLTRVVFLDGYAVLAYGNTFGGEGALSLGTVQIVNEKGAVTGDIVIGEMIDYLSAAGDTIVAGSSRKFRAINTKGKLLWEYTATHDVNQLLPGSARDFLLVSKNDARLIPLDEESVKPTEDAMPDVLPENASSEEDTIRQPIEEILEDPADQAEDEN